MIILKYLGSTQQIIPNIEVIEMQHGEAEENIGEGARRRADDYNDSASKSDGAGSDCVNEEVMLRI